MHYTLEMMGALLQPFVYAVNIYQALRCYLALTLQTTLIVFVFSNPVLIQYYSRVSNQISFIQHVAHEL